MVTLKGEMPWVTVENSPEDMSPDVAHLRTEGRDWWLRILAVLNERLFFVGRWERDPNRICRVSWTAIFVLTHTRARKSRLRRCLLVFFERGAEMSRNRAFSVSRGRWSSD